MNLNQSFLHKKKRDGFGIPPFKVKQTMGPPIRPPPKSRTKQKSMSTPSSGTNWGKSCQSLFNSSVLRSASTTVSTENESRVIIALTEGRGDARCEVGLASIDLSLPTLILCQISDSQSYINTLTKVNILNPTDIIVPSTFLENNNRLIDNLKKTFPNIKTLGVPRKTFNKSNGIDRILQLCLPSVNTICVGLQHKYYALAAASALITYLQNNLNIYYAKESINVSYQESEGYAIIDFATADRLELVSSTKPAQASRYSTLFGVLNHCVTKVGTRLLRSTILQPASSPKIIEKTLHCVSELIKHPQMLLSIQAILQKVSNIDQLLTLTSMTIGTNDSCSVRQLNYLLLLNGLIDLIEPLKDVIDNCQQPFFKELKKTLESDNFAVITRQIRTMIHPSAQFAKSEAGITQRCYAIKSGINGLLDLVRKTYSERLNDMNEYIKHLGNKYNLPLSLGNNNTKGYHIVLKLNSQQKRTFKKSDLPPEFIQVYRLAGSFTFKTTELINYSTRLEDIMVEILKISNLMIKNIIAELKQHLGFFYKLCEDIAQLDVLQSLAEASRRRHYTRPKFGDFTELTNARHPMLELLIGDQSVANPISICKDSNVQIITGPNGSGKSIYIRQVIILQIMAQVGCYVPADSAIFKPMSRMFARIYLEDDMEYGASSFILEMKEVKYMMTLLSESSLFIIDELCRSTAADEGATLATAICEKFCTTSVFLYVTTHYTSLADNLANVFLNVKTWQMETVASGDTPQDLTLDFRFKLVPGVTSLEHYGVYIVKKIWPESILREVYSILASCKNNSKRRDFTNEAANAIMLKYKLESDLRKMKSLKKLTPTLLKELLNEYQNNLKNLKVSINLVKGSPDVSLNSANSPPHSAFETSSYQNLSNFIKENSDNINKLIPEVSIESSDRELVLADESQNSGPPFWGANIQKDSFESCEELVLAAGDGVNSFENDASHMVRNGEASSGVSFENLKSKNSFENDAGHVTENGGSSSLPTVWGGNLQDLSDSEMKLIAEELEDASKSLLEDLDADFDFSQATSYRTATQRSCNEHIFPVVKVVEGPQWSRDSSFCEKEEEIKEKSFLSESISYSPLCSQSSMVQEARNSDLTNVNKESKSTSSSSLHFLTRAANGACADLTNASTIEDITVENLKSSTEKPSSSEKGSPKKSKKPKRFIPPKRLTRKEIQEEFDEQDRKIYETDITESDFSKYLSQILNRPSVKQVQESQHLAFVRKTEDGVRVIPAKPDRPKKGKFSFKRNLSSNSNIDMSIFSDKNAKRFDEFVNSDERDVKRFKFHFESSQNEKVGRTFNFEAGAISDYAAVFENTNEKSGFGENSVVTVFPSFTPEGYYKENRDDIDNIVNKYLQLQKDEANIFETCSLNEQDLNL